MKAPGAYPKEATADGRIADNIVYFARTLRKAGMFEGHQNNQPPQEVPEIEVDARFTFSGNEVLRGKDFAQMNAAEMADAKKAIAELRLPFDMPAMSG